MKFFVFCALIAGFQAVSGQGVDIFPDYTPGSDSALIFIVKKPLVLACNVSTSEPNDKIDVEWKKDEVLVGEVESLKGRFTLGHEGHRHTLTITRPDYHDAGTWRCSAIVDGQTNADASKTINVATTIAVRIKSENINVVEEEKLRIDCSVLGNPHPRLEWKIDSENYNFSALDSRVQIQDYQDDTGKTVVNGTLIIENVNEQDRGIYYCNGTNQYFINDTAGSASTIRVKGKYAALWPFLGICLEVVVLCAIIIIYEKKRNKTELEESDTDQSPDQKNTPDHGKEANLRHRQ